MGDEDEGTTRRDAPTEATAPLTERTDPPLGAVPTVGETIGDRWEVEGTIGSGGMAHVVSARDRRTNRRFAIKVLDPELASSENARARFAREARAVAKLTGRHVVRVHDVDALPSGVPYMVMDLLEGRDLSQVLKEDAPLPIADVCRWIEQACTAIEEAHRAGIVHRDLKPRNIFLTSDGVRVLDFGIAQTRDGLTGNLQTLTKAGDVLGTLTYAAPEQIKNSKLVDPRADIWSLGVTLHRLLTGDLPFKGDTELEIVESVLTREPEPPSSRRTGVPRAVDEVVARCLRKRPEERFATARELELALAAARSEPARPPKPFERTLPTTGNAPPPAATSSGALPPAAPSSGALPPSSGARPPASSARVHPPAPTLPVHAPARVPAVAIAAVVALALVALAVLAYVGLLLAR